MSACMLFLDSDGVTHPDPCLHVNFFCRLPLIEEMIREFSMVNIVVSSSWRDHHSLVDLTQHFAPDIRFRVVDTTTTTKSLSSAWLPSLNREFVRQWECELWMEEHRYWGARWLAIDDRAYWFEPQCPNLLTTDPAMGFQSGDQVTLRQMLRERI